VNRAELLERHCRPQEGKPALGRAEAERWLAAIPDWKLNDTASAIERTFRFQDYYRTMAFVNALAFIVHGEDHHPDLEVGYNRCTVRFSTHSVKGLSENDFICAAKIDALPAS
jgi:4a-hydroxytetrahydrobiopterin dehydratase